MNDDIFAPKKKPPVHEIGIDLTTLSVAELRERIDLLKAEIARLETSISSKMSSKAAAESVFKL